MLQPPSYSPGSTIGGNHRRMVMNETLDVMTKSE
jgi:hypothetical protein